MRGMLGSGSTPGAGFKSLPRTRLVEELFFLGACVLLPSETCAVKRVARRRPVPKLGSGFI